MRAIARRIYFDSNTNRYYPRPSLNGKVVPLGSYFTQEAAQEILDAFDKEFPANLVKRGRKPKFEEDSITKSINLEKINLMKQKLPTTDDRSA